METVGKMVFLIKTMLDGKMTTTTGEITLIKNGVILIGEKM